MIDIHSHLLPEIDDGARSAEQAVQTLRLLAEQGVAGMVMTPHVTAGELAANPDGAVARRARAEVALRAADPPDIPERHLGFEIMLDQPLGSSVLRDRRLSLAGSRYFLVEFPLSIVAVFARRTLAGFGESGAVPVVAHPERYDACSPQTIREWREVGARIQVDATTLTRPTTRGHRARQLLGAGLVDVLAADNHGDRRSIAVGAQYLIERGAEFQAHLLTDSNPAAIVQDGDLEAVPPMVVKESFIARLKRIAKGY